MISTYTGSHLKSLSGFTEYFYDPTTDLPSHSLLNRWIIVSGGTHLVAATTFPDQYLANFSTPDGTKNVIRCFPISDSSGLASDGTWTTYKGTITDGLHGENMCASPDQGLPYFADPDSTVASDALGSTVTVSGGTGFVGTTTLGVVKLVGSLMKWVDIGDALPPAVSYSGNWTLNHPAFKLSDAQALVTPVTTYTGDLVLGLIGDSLTFNIGTGSLFATHLATAFPNANSITLDNLGSSGKKTSDWVPGQALYTSAVATANSHGWKVCNLCLGVNDVNTGVSASTILANLRLIVDGLFADIPTLKKIVVQDIPSPSGSSTTTANTAISAIGHGADYTTAPFYSILWANSVLAEDTLHPSDDAGRHYQSLTWLIPLSTAIPAAEGPTVPTNPANASDTTGTVITATFSEDVVGVLPGQFEMSDGFRVRSMIGSGTSWDFTITPALVFGDAPTLDYTGTSTVSADDDTLAMETFSGHAITNNVPDPALSVPDAPILTVAEPVFSGIAMDMEAGASDGGYPIIEFEVWRKVDTDAYAKVATIPNDIAVTSGYFDNTTTIGQVVKFKARTRNWAGFSPFSDESDGESAGPVRPYLHFAASINLYRGLSRALS